MKPISILALQETPGIGIKTVDKILSMSDIPELACPNDIIEILKKANEIFGKISIPNIQQATIGWEQALKIWELSKQHDIQIIPRHSTKYPKFVLQISDPPALLHIKGNIEALNKDCIAIVGTREPTDFGKAKAKKVGEIFAKDGYVVISGLAVGIDTAAHTGAIEANGITVAVLANGLNTIYPAKNKKLAADILENNGVLLSEYSYGSRINRSSFVARDRIQSALSLGVFVIETDVKGGTKHTAKFCKEHKRALIVLQHPDNLATEPKARGNSQLISDKLADIVFKENEDINLVKEKMKDVKDELLKFELEKTSPTIIKNLEYFGEVKSSSNFKSRILNSDYPSTSYNKKKRKSDKYIDTKLGDYGDL